MLFYHDLRSNNRPRRPNSDHRLQTWKWYSWYDVKYCFRSASKNYKRKHFEETWKSNKLLLLIHQKLSYCRFQISQKSLSCLNFRREKLFKLIYHIIHPWPGSSVNWTVFGETERSKGLNYTIRMNVQFGTSTPCR